LNHYFGPQFGPVDADSSGPKERLKTDYDNRPPAPFGKHRFEGAPRVGSFKKNLHRFAKASATAPDQTGQTASQSGLFAQGAGVHVDFHADLHFDNLRGLPRHSASSQLRSAR
jgi:hypothetical protein